MRSKVEPFQVRRHTTFGKLTSLIRYLLTNRRELRELITWTRIKKVPRFALNVFLDSFRFFVDNHPRRTAYQPLPWLRLEGGRRAKGSAERWKAIRPELERLNARTALDIGANAGFLTIAMGQVGINVMAVETDPRHVRTISYARRKLELDNVLVLDGWLEPGSIRLLPEVDVTVFLSVWHHWVRVFGLESATEMTEVMWKRTRRALFFDTGGSELQADYDLPVFRQGDESWLGEYLSTTCGSEHVVRTLGAYQAFKPGGNEKRGVVSRPLMMVERTPARSKVKI